MLPDGWYGRPYDSVHQLTRLREIDGTLTLCLDDHLTLDFERLMSVRHIGGNLIFGPFARLRFDWIAYGGSGERGSKEYASGEVWMFAALRGDLQSPLIHPPIGGE